MNAPNLNLILASLIPLSACILPAADDDTGGATSNDAVDGTNGDDGSGDDSSSTPSDDSDSDGADETGSDADSDSGSSDGNDTTEMPATDCSEATLRMGSPYFTGDLEGWDPAGQGLFAEPPLRSRHLAVLGDQLAVETQFEIWLADDTEVHRIAGDELEPEEQYQPSGPCADVRFLVAAGVTALPNGNLIVADIRGNALVELSDPLGECVASPIAGNPDQTFDVDVQDGAAAADDIDGPGAQARFFGVARPISDDAGNIYVVDTGNSKIKRVAADRDRTVSTISTIGADDVLLAMTVLDGTLFVTGTNATQDFVWAIDPSNGDREVLFQGVGLFEEVGPSQQASMFALSNDGVDLIVASNKGWIFRMSTSAESLGVIAGTGAIVDYPELDLSMPIPTAELPIRSYGINDAGMVRDGNDILFTNNAAGVGFHVWSIHCM